MIFLNTGILEGHGLDSGWRTKKIYFRINSNSRTLLNLLNIYQLRTINWRETAGVNPKPLQLCLVT